jgi:hypothetical protein
MGIRLLQKFLKQNNVLTREMHMRSISGKKIAIDIGIYLYRFKQLGVLIENLYLMCSIFRYYNIHPIFVFDGWALDIKRKTLEKRKDIRKKAEEDLRKLRENVDEKTKNDNTYKIQCLKKQCVCVKKKDYDEAKNFLDAYGMTYITAKREADEVCGALYLKKKIWGCMTEDSDIMVYGCGNILRYFSLINHTFILYDMSYIIKNDLKLSTYNFKELCVCSGNDYIKSNRNIFYYYNLIKNCKTPDINFMDWLLNNKYISIQKYYEMKDIMNLYLMNSYNPFEDIPYMVIKNKAINEKKTMKILRSVNFVFA